MRAFQTYLTDSDIFKPNKLYLPFIQSETCKEDLVLKWKPDNSCFTNEVNANLLTKEEKKTLTLWGFTGLFKSTYWGSKRLQIISVVHRIILR